MILGIGYGAGCQGSRGEMRYLGSVVFVLVCSLLAAVPLAYAQKRVALVIGNSAYQHTPTLTNPDQ